MDKPMSHLFILPVSSFYRRFIESFNEPVANRSALQSNSLPIFERGYRGFVFQDVADFIESLEDASLGEGIDWKSDSGAALDRKCLGSEIDRYGPTWLQQRVSLSIHNNRQESIF